MLNDDLLQCIREGGTSVLVGTADTQCVPACCRGVAAKIAPDLSRVVAYVPVATSRDVIANAAATRRVAVVVTRPIEHTSVQMKGTIETVRLATADEEEFIRERLEQFACVLDTIGIPRRRVRAVTHWPAFAIETKVDEVFDQTPGPRAGTPLR
jgi:hypothetical protein